MMLIAFGMVMVYSSSSVAAAYDEKIGDPLFFVKRQAIFASVGIFAALVLRQIDYRIWQRFALPIFGTTILVLLATLVIGTDINNARRWIRLGPLSIQPSEVAKLSVVLAGAAYVTLRRDRLSSFREGFVPAMIGLGLLGGLVVVQPDLGTTIFLMTLGGVVLLAGGIRLRHVAVVGAIAMPLVITVMFLEFGHVQDRILVFLDPEADKLGKGHQAWQSLIAIGSGGLEGRGLGESTQKLFYLPEEHTDFIFAIVVEELGFIGSAFTMFCFACLAYFGHRISKHAPDRFGALIALGVTAAIILQAGMNIAVATSSMPTTGIALPFVSFGGTGLVIALAGIGIVLNVAKQALPRDQVASLRVKEYDEECGGAQRSGLPGPTASGVDKRHVMGIAASMSSK